MYGTSGCVYRMSRGGSTTHTFLRARYDVVQSEARNLLYLREQMVILIWHNVSAKISQKRGHFREIKWSWGPQGQTSNFQVWPVQPKPRVGADFCPQRQKCCQGQRGLLSSYLRHCDSHVTLGVGDRVQLALFTSLPRTWNRENSRRSCPSP